MTLFVAESIEQPAPTKLFTILGAEYRVTPWSWLNLPLMAFIGIVLALLFAPDGSEAWQILVGLGYGLLIILSSFLHGVGHVISSRLVGGPVTWLVATATVNVTQYHDVEGQPRRVDVGRSLGGPVFNILLGVVAGGVYAFAGRNHFIGLFAVVNLAFGVFTLMPIPSLDGSVIWRSRGAHTDDPDGPAAP